MFQTVDHSVVLHFEQSEECADCAAILCQILQNHSGPRDAGLAGFTILEGTPASAYQSEWARFDTIKITKSRIQKRRTLLVSGVHGIIHVFKTAQLTNGAIIADKTPIHKVVRIAKYGVALERDPVDRRKLRWSALTFENSSGIVASKAGSDYLFRSRQERERFAAHLVGSDLRLGPKVRENGKKRRTLDDIHLTKRKPDASVMGDSDSLDGTTSRDEQLHFMDHIVRKSLMFKNWPTNVEFEARADARSKGDPSSRPRDKQIQSRSSSLESQTIRKRIERTVSMDVVKSSFVSDIWRIPWAHARVKIFCGS